MATFEAVSQLSDDALLAALRRLVADDARITASLVAHLAEVDQRRLHAREAYPSLFAYCTGALHLSEQAAYLRIQAARVSRRCPRVLEALARGELSLSAVKLLDQPGRTRFRTRPRRARNSRARTPGPARRDRTRNDGPSTCGRSIRREGVTNDGLCRPGPTTANSAARNRSSQAR